MSTESNKALVRRFVEEVWGQRNLSFIDEAAHRELPHGRHLRPTFSTASFLHDEGGQGGDGLHDRL